MAKLAVFEAAMNMALSPFRDTEFEKKRVYLRRPVPWDLLASSSPALIIPMAWS
ncbi:unnamed protein product, partial [marine sediment metagenome]